MENKCLLHKTLVHTGTEAWDRWGQGREKAQNNYIMLGGQKAEKEREHGGGKINRLSM